MDAPDLSANPPITSASRWMRMAAAVLVVSTVGAGVFELLRHPDLLSFDPRAHAAEIRHWADARPWLGPLGFVGLFLTLGTFALPVWWLNVVAGVAFGLAEGLLLGLIASAVTSAAATTLSRFAFGDWLRGRLAAHTQRLTRLDESLNHNGLLVVCGVRLLHFIPAGLSNYAFGLTRISIRDVAIGSVVGGLPSTLSLVMIGARPNWLHDWRFIAVLVTLNLATVVVLIVRYLRPRWFKRFGVE